MKNRIRTTKHYGNYWIFFKAKDESQEDLFAIKFTNYFIDSPTNFQFLTIMTNYRLEIIILNIGIAFWK